jgi:transcriptional regulator with XRE-family HTH domain
LLEAPEIGGAEFKFARKALGVTQPELAELLGINAFTVSHYETGDYPITRQTALAMVAVLQQALQGPEWPPKAWFETRKEPSKEFKIPANRKCA